MPSLPERYKKGEYTQVWSELLAFGPAIRDEPLYSEALAVARETMSRAKRNVEILVDHLASVGYRFGIYPDGSPFPYYDSPLSGSTSETIQQVDELEAQVGPLPLSLRIWWETVGSVNLIGRHPDWPEYSDPLVVDPPEATFEDLEWWAEFGRADEWVRPTSKWAAIAPDYFHKDNISGGEPYEIFLPNAAVDAKLEYEWHNTTFVNYLRICFRWGGFPGLERVRGEFKWLPQLTSGLLPL